ncbi:nuclease HARBI1 [Trichonephila clavipes]|nr:nuclease HARBI1 [Trichonephila clavipes]
MNTIQKVSTVTQLDFLEKLEARKVRKLVEKSKTPCNNALNPVEQVLVAQRFYAVVIADLFHVSQPTVCRVVHRVSEAMASLLPDFIHLPVNREEYKKVLDLFLSYLEMVFLPFPKRLAEPQMKT